MRTEFSSAMAKMEEMRASATSISEIAKKKANQAIEKINKKKGKNGNWEESTIVIESEVEDKAATRRERAGDKDVWQLVLIVDGPMIAAVLEHNVNWNLGEEEKPIEIRNFDRSPRWQRIQGIDWKSLALNSPCSMYCILPQDFLK